MELRKKLESCGIDVKDFNEYTWEIARGIESMVLEKGITFKEGLRMAEKVTRRRCDEVETS